MKVLFVAVFTPNSTNVSQSRGFKANGCEVYEYDYRANLVTHKNINGRDDDLINVIKSFKPDLTVFSKCNQMNYRVVDSANAVGETVLWYMDALHNFDAELIDKIKRCTYFINGLEGVRTEGLKYNPNTVFINQCPDDKLNFMLDDFEYKHDISFIGSIDPSGIHDGRGRYVKLLKDKFDGFNHFNGVYGLEHNRLVNESRINLNFSPSDATGASVRIYKILASGGFLMSTPWYDMEKTFNIGEDIIIFEDEKELIKKVTYYLNNENERNRIRLNGYRVVQQYLPKGWAKRIMDLIR
jgi:hypothetical protein